MSARLIPTLNGNITPERLGRTLMHEHIFCRIKEKNVPLASAYLRDELTRIKALGIDTIVDVTTYVSPETLLPILRDLDINIICCAGFYLNSKIPGAYRTYNVAALVDVMQRKITIGLGRSGVKRTMEALAITQKVFGLPLQMHACRGGVQQLEFLMTKGADPEKIIICHHEMNLKGRYALPFATVLDHAKAIVNQGSSLFIGDLPITKNTYRGAIIALIRQLVAEGHEDRIVLSVDSHWSCRSKGVYLRGVPLQKPHARKYGYIFSEVLPSLQRAGIHRNALDKMLLGNPRRLMTCPEIGG
jgi:phosphotriesterase-related protein